MVMNGVWTTNTHSVNVSVHDWDDEDCLVTLESVRLCFNSTPNCDHHFVRVGDMRLVPRFAVTDFNDQPLIRRTTMKVKENA